MRKMKLIILSMLVMCMVGLSNLSAYEKKNTTLSNIVGEINSINYENLEVEGYQYIKNEIDFSKVGKYSLKYQNNTTNEYLNRNLYLIDPNDYNEHKRMVVSEITKPNDNLKVIDICKDNEYTYVIYDNNKLYCYFNGYEMWSKTFDDFHNVELKKIDSTNTGVLVYYSGLNNGNWDIILDEYNKNGLRINRCVLKGSKDDYAESMKKIGNYIYVSGVTYSNDQDYEGFYRKEGDNLAFVGFVEYEKFKYGFGYYYGDEGINEIVDTIYMLDYIVLKTKNINSDQTDIKTGQDVSLHLLDYNYYLSRIGSETFDEYGLTGNEKVIGLDEYYGIIVKNESSISLHYTTTNMELTGRVTTLYTNLEDYNLVDYQVLNYYNRGLIVLNYENEDSQIYKLYKVNNNAFEEVYVGRGKFLKFDQNFFEEENGKIIETINFKATSAKKTGTQKGYLVERNYYVNKNTVLFQRITEDNTSYGLFDVLYKYYISGTEFYVKGEEFIESNCNVKNGETYDLGLVVEFNGKGYLNEVEIISGLRIEEEGLYVLMVEANNEEKTEYVFEVKSLSENNINLTTPNVETNNELVGSVNSEVNLDINCDGIEVVEEGSKTLDVYIAIIFAVVGIIIAVIIKKIKNNHNCYYSFIIVALLFSFNFQKLNASTNEELCLLTKEVDYEIIDKIDEYELIKDSGVYLTYQDETIYEFEGSSFKLDLKNNRLYVFYIEENFLRLATFTEENCNYDRQVIDNPFFQEFEVNYLNGYFYIISSTDEFTNSDLRSIKIRKNYLDKMCGVVLKINLDGKITNVNIYGGKTNDYLLDISNINNNIVILGTREKQGGGDFGNIGSNDEITFVALVNEALELEKYVIINDKFLNNKINKLNDKIVIFFDEMAYIYDAELKNLYTYQLDSEYALTDSECTIYCFSDKKISTINVSTNIYNCYDNPLIEGIKEIRYLNNIAYLKGKRNYLFNLLNFEMMPTSNIYNPNIELEYVCYSLNGKEKGIPNQTQYFDPMIHGEYTYLVDFNLDYFTTFSKEVNVKVLEEINIVSGRIYPVGYNIIFKGIARLNGEIINNNYSLKNPGKYTLTLEDNKKNITTIDFTVATEQLEFEDQSVKTIDYYTLGTDVRYFLFVELDNNIEIDKFIIDNEDFFNYKYTKNDEIEIDILFKNYRSGVYNHRINGFYYYKEDNYYYYQIEKDISFSIYGSDLYAEVIEIGKKDDLKNEITLKYSFNDYYNLSRNLYLKFVKDNVEENSLIALGTKEVLLELEDSDYEKCEIYYVYDVNSENKYLKLCDIYFDESNDFEVLGKVIVSNQNGKIDLEITLSDDFSKDVEKIYVKEILKYSNKEVDYTSKIIIALVAFGVTFGGTMIILKLKR